jgi:predicted dehydrogenase
MNNKSVRWGIISTAFIADYAFIPALQQTQRGQPIEQFHDCLLDDAEPLVTVANAIGTLRIIEAVLESSRSGRHIELG